jgi:hypothetical protein
MIHGTVATQTRPYLDDCIMKDHITPAETLQLESCMYNVIHDVPDKVGRTSQSGLRAQSNITVGDPVSEYPAI